MVKEIKEDEFNPNKLSVVMFYMEGCGACENAKPQLEKVSKEHDEADFYKIQLSPSSYEKLYNVYEEKTVKQTEEVLDDNGEPVLTKSGKPFKRHKLDEKGNIILNSPMIAPNFFFFHPESAEGDDKLGFLGNVRGADINKVEAILDQMKELADE